MNSHAHPINERLAALVKVNALEMLGGERTLARALDLAHQAHAWADHLIGRFEAEKPLPHPLACQPGCHFCCHNQIEVTPLEALAVWRFIQDLPPDEQARLKNRVEASARQRSSKTKEEIARSRRQFPCPFLHQGLCVVYPVRPLLCRAMHSLDAGHCETSLQAETLLPDQYYLHRDEIVWSIVQGLNDGCKAAGCQSNPVDLAQAVSLFLPNMQDHEVVEQWLWEENLARNLT
jgi:Fe-S-cluster containining protein